MWFVSDVILSKCYDEVLMCASEWRLDNTPVMICDLWRNGDVEGSFVSGHTA